MKSKKKVVKKTLPKSKPRGYSYTPRTKPKTRTKIQYITRIMPVAKTYKIIRPFDAQVPENHGEIRAYEDGIQVCIFDIEHQRAEASAIFHLKALAYKEEKI